MKRVKICMHIVIWSCLLMIAGAVALYLSLPKKVNLETTILSIGLIVLPALVLLIYLLVGAGTAKAVQDERDEAVAAALRKAFAARRDTGTTTGGGPYTGGTDASGYEKVSPHPPVETAYVPPVAPPSGDTVNLMKYNDNPYARVKCPYCETEYDASASACPVCGMARGT